MISSVPYGVPSALLLGALIFPSPTSKREWVELMDPSPQSDSNSALKVSKAILRKKKNNNKKREEEEGTNKISILSAAAPPVTIPEPPLLVFVCYYRLLPPYQSFLVPLSGNL